VRASRTDLWEPRGEVPRGHPAAALLVGSSLGVDSREAARLVVSRLTVKRTEPSWHSRRGIWHRHG